MCIEGLQGPGSSSHKQSVSHFILDGIGASSVYRKDCLLTHVAASVTRGIRTGTHVMLGSAN